ADREKLEHITLGGLRRAVCDGDMIRGSVMSGQVCGQLTAIRPVVEILDEMVTGAKNALSKAASIEL
ncbi:MAG: enoyl-[acyl-carrier-protein] reductase FabK, partial [Pseudobutyrivibrio sp.]|nr:enoyl-[acyl-carrier-protein] reductase FabK [Pseudobutyrivibrio sp.]